jgi:hypothetical protein
MAQGVMRRERATRISANPAETPDPTFPVRLNLGAMRRFCLRLRAVNKAVGLVGAKYQPSIKDLKATLRFHQNAKRAAATGAIKKSLYMPSLPPRQAPIKTGESGKDVRSEK